MENRIVQKKMVAIFVLDLLVFAQCLCDSLFRSSRVGQATPETNHGRRLARDDGGHAVQLNSGNFHEFLQNNKYVMVFFVSSPPGKHQIRLSFRCWNPLRRSRFFVWPSTHLVQQIHHLRTWRLEGAISVGAALSRVAGVRRQPPFVSPPSSSLHAPLVLSLLLTVHLLNFLCDSDVVCLGVFCCAYAYSTSHGVSGTRRWRRRGKPSPRT